MKSTDISYNIPMLVPVTLLILFGIFAHITNPFTRFTIVRHVHYVTDQEKFLRLIKVSRLRVKNHMLWKILSNLKSAWHILVNRFGLQDVVRSHEADEIIAKIHAKRFSPENHYLISGDHFSVMYPRSLGIFYHSILDSRTALTPEDWLNRQKIYLKTTAYALTVYEDAPHLSTTIVPVLRESVMLANYYAYPSDTLYSLLYALDQLTGSNSLQDIYPFSSHRDAPLLTKDAGKELLTTFDSSLRRHIKTYSHMVFDAKTGLIRTDILLSGTKDIAKRWGAFYDNVIFWHTHALAQKLGLIPQDHTFLRNLKQNILDAYWRTDGYFLEDLSAQAQEQGWYSSDWLIAFQTGFLDPKNSHDLAYLRQGIEYIIREKIDLPLPLRYHNDFRKRRLHFPVNIAARDYGSKVIWSHWGTEYIKALLRLYQCTKKNEYLKRAKKHLDAYEYNIVRYKGYPEVYDDHGNMYTSLFYKSVRMTGWVVSFEQARAMYRAT